MDEKDFEGSEVLEKLAAIDQVDAFLAAVDADDVPRAISLMRRAKVDASSLAMVIKKMEEAGGET